MIYLCCDTNIWINISNGLEPPRLLTRLYDEIQADNICLVLPEIVKKEWERNKEKAVLSHTKFKLTDQILELKKLNDFLEKQDVLDFEMSFLLEEIDNPLETKKQDNIIEIKERVEILIVELQKYKNDIIEKAKLNIETVENIFDHPNTVLLPTDKETSLFVINLATEKKFPFEGSKNNFADCLIFFQFNNYIKNLNLEKSHFVTSNKKEFFPTNDKLHDLYNNEILITKSFFHKSLSEALNTSLEKDLVSFKELKRVNELIDYDYEFDLDDHYCLSCNVEGEVDGGVFSFIAELDVLDRREKVDKNQYRLFEDELPTLPGENKEPVELADVGVCNSCGVPHVKCPICNSIWFFEKNEYNEKFYCQGCNLNFIYETVFNDSLNPYRLVLFDDEDECPDCGSEFFYHEDGIDYCENCDYKKSLK